MKISRYIFISSLLLLSATTFAQEAKKENSLAFKGISLSADLYGYIGTIFNDYASGEVAISANLGNRFFPVIEVGYGTTDTTDETTQIHYKSSAPYYRAGLNYNFLYKKERLHDYRIYAIGRYGYTKAKYDVTTPPATDPVWGGTSSIELKDVEATCSWFELGAGIEAKIWKNISMGWSLRYKSLIKDGKGEKSQIWYIPGYGENKSGSFGGTYSIIYNIPIGKK